MTAGWMEIFVVAMTAQLAVLPGEKVQFIIAGLATRYNPWVVVAAAGSAFAGWTAIELVVGEALKGAFPVLYLDVFTAGLFLLFAVLLWRSAPGRSESATGRPQPDGGSVGGQDISLHIRGHEVPEYLGGFLPIFALMAAGEFGDKTQLVTIGLAVQYGAHPAIWAGEMVAIIPVSIANAFFFHSFAHRFDLRKAHDVGALVFAFFGLDTILAIATGFSVWGTLVGAVSTAILSVI